MAAIIFIVGIAVFIIVMLTLSIAAVFLSYVLIFWLLGLFISLFGMAPVAIYNTVYWPVVIAATCITLVIMAMKSNFSLEVK